MSNHESGSEGMPDPQDPSDIETPSQELLQRALDYIKLYSALNTHSEIIRDQQTGEVLDLVSHEVDSNHGANSLPHFIDDRSPQISYVFFLATTDADLQAGKVGTIQEIDWSDEDKAVCTNYELTKGQRGLLINKFQYYQRIFHADNQQTDGDGSFVTPDEFKAAHELERDLGLLSMDRKETQDLLGKLAAAQLRPTS